MAEFAIGDIIQVDWKQSFLGQILRNVQFYQVITRGADAILLDVAGVAKANFANNVATMQNGVCSLTEVQVNNATDGLGQAILPVTDVVGSGGGEALPAFIAVAIKQVRGSRLTRHGRKAIGGLSESENNGGALVLSGGAITNLETFATSPLERSGDPPTDFNMIPVIIGRTLVVVDDKNTYPLDLSKVNSITSAEVNLTLSSQNSRKPGHGE